MLSKKLQLKFYPFVIKENKQTNKKTSKALVN